MHQNRVPVCCPSLSCSLRKWSHPRSDAMGCCQPVSRQERGLRGAEEFNLGRSRSPPRMLFSSPHGSPDSCGPEVLHRSNVLRLPASRWYRTSVSRGVTQCSSGGPHAKLAMSSRAKIQVRRCAIAAETGGVLLLVRSWSLWPTGAPLRSRAHEMFVPCSQPPKASCSAC